MHLACVFCAHTKDTAAHAAASSSSADPLKQPAARTSLKFFSERPRDVAPCSNQKFIAAFASFYSFFLIYLKVVWPKEKKKILYLRNFVECSLMNFCRGGVLNRLGKQIMRGNCLVMEALLFKQKIIIVNVFKCAVQTINKIVFNY